MDKEMKNPPLRFKQSDGTQYPDWLPITLKDVCDNISGTSLEKFMDKELGTHKVISIGNYSTDGKFSDDGNRIILNEKSVTKLLNKNDLVMVLNDKTKTGDIIGSTILIDKDNTYIYNQRSERLICKNNILPKFLWWTLNSPLGRKKIFALSQGGTQIYVNFSAVKNVNISLPHLDEQQKIAEFLSVVDKRIALLQAKYDHLQKYKTGILQKIFTQQIRFKKPNGTNYPDWQPMLLNEVFELKLGKVLRPKDISPEYSKNTPYRVFSSQTKNNGVMGYYSEYLFENAITWTTRGENTGDCKYRKGKFYPNNNCGVAIPKKQYAGYANTCIAEMIDKISCKYVSRSSIPILANNVFGTIKIDFPELDEQKRIADFLSAIDKKITKTQKQITATKSFKSGLLQKMFI